MGPSPTPAHPSSRPHSCPPIISPRCPRSPSYLPSHPPWISRALPTPRPHPSPLGSLGPSLPPLSRAQSLGPPLPCSPDSTFSQVLSGSQAALLPGSCPSSRQPGPGPFQGPGALLSPLCTHGPGNDISLWPSVAPTVNGLTAFLVQILHPHLRIPTLRLPDLTPQLQTRLPQFPLTSPLGLPQPPLPNRPSSCTRYSTLSTGTPSLSPRQGHQHRCPDL